MNISSRISAAFDTALRSHGFALTDEPLVFVRIGKDGNRDQIEVEVPSYLNGISVTLQSFDLEGKLRREKLERFRGVRYFEYDKERTESVDGALATVVSDLNEFGLPWFSGEDIRTPAVEARKRLVDNKNYETRTSSARDAFKKKSYARAIELFDEAARIRPLDPVDERFRQIAIGNTSHR